MIKVNSETKLVSREFVLLSSGSEDTEGTPRVQEYRGLSAVSVLVLIQIMKSWFS